MAHCDCFALDCILDTRAACDPSSSSESTSGGYFSSHEDWYNVIVGDSYAGPLVDAASPLAYPKPANTGFSVHGSMECMDTIPLIRISANQAMHASRRVDFIEVVSCSRRPRDRYRSAIEGRVKMQRLLTSLLILLVTSSIALSDDPRPITSAGRVFAIYTEDWGLGSAGKPKLIFAAWGDGHVVWSHDQLNGGGPYRSSTVDLKRFTSTIDRLRTIGVFDTPRFNDAKFGPDSQFTTILIHDGEQKLKMRSWHELFESNGKTIAANHGVTSLSGRSLISALGDEPSRYLGYRIAWLEIRLAAANLIPASGAETKGRFQMRHAIASWAKKEEAEP